MLSFGPIGWLMISEIFPLKLRGRGHSIAVLVNFGANALVTFAFSPLKELLGAGILFIGFGVICVMSMLFIFFIVPEVEEDYKRNFDFNFVFASATFFLLSMAMELSLFELSKGINVD